MGRLRPEWITFPVHGDQRGILVVIEGERDVPFDISRTYFLPWTRPGIARGFHAHRRLDQVLIAAAGSCTIVLDDGHERIDVPLDRPEVGLRVGPMVWHEMHDFSRDCVLLVLAAAHYDEADYIRDYEDFISSVRGAPPNDR